MDRINCRKDVAHQDIVIYQTKDGLTKIDVQFENETVWISQEQMSSLFDKAESIYKWTYKTCIWRGRTWWKSGCSEVPNYHATRCNFRKDGTKVIDDNALAALTLMVATSNPKEKDMIIKIILNLL